jgi:RNA recognition motif-containing protein
MQRRIERFLLACRKFSYPFPMSIRLYVGNLPQTFDAKELEALFSAVGEGVRFKAVNDRDTGACRGFGFANVDDQKLADTVIEQLNGKDFGGNALRIEVSERKDSRSAAPSERRNGSAPTAARKAVNKVVHADNVDSEAPDPRWAGELAKLKSLLANQTAAV